MKMGFGFLAAIAFSSGLHAQQLTDTVSHSRKAHFTIDVNAGGTYTQVAEIVNAISVPSDINTLGSARVVYNSRLQEAEIIEAATIKENGERLSVSPGTITIQDVPVPGNATMIHELKYKVIVFPKLEVGDSVYYKARITQKTPEFPGEFSLAQVFPENTAWDDVKVTVSAPKNYPLQVKASGVAGGVPADHGNTRTWTWTYKNMQAHALEPGMVSLAMYSPHIFVSSFNDYRALAAAYQAVSHDKAKVTPAVQSLADDLTKDVTDHREQVKRLYDWVTHNIRYTAIFLHIGGYVPHAADAVLNSRYGDCKDHVVLLEALLAAKGIASTPALIDSRPNYTLPEVAVPQSFNHVITYVPSLDLYVDSTNPYAPFGTLPFEDTDKPVIHTAGYSGIKHTPVSADGNASISKTVVAFDKNGFLEGSTTIRSNGAIGIFMRGLAANITPMREAEFLRQVFSQAGLPNAQGRLDKPQDADSGINVFSVRYSEKNALDMSTAGALTLNPPLTNPMSLGNAVRALAIRERKYPYLCAARTVEENFEVTFPSSLKIVAIPKAVSVETGEATYHSFYRLEGGKLTASRRFVTTARSNVCEPSHYKEHRDMIGAIVNDLRSQVLYQVQ